MGTLVNMEAVLGILVNMGVVLGTLVNMETGGVKTSPCRSNRLNSSGAKSLSTLNTLEHLNK